VVSGLPKNLVDKLANIPRKPGVYLYKDKKGEIIYVGKAKILRNRVRSYFQKGRAYDPKQNRLVSRIADLETIITDSEVEALILEANLIKEYKPRYNINLKDDKSFPYIRVTNEPFPRIFPTRKLVRDGSKYFGPYTDVYGMRELLKTIKRIFPVRSCNLNLTPESIEKKKFQVCLDYHIKRCHGPCEGLVSQKEYNDVIDYVVSFIQGHTKRVEQDIQKQIKELASSMRFEEAARLRDQLQSIEMFQQRQKIVDPSFSDRDFIANANADEDSCCVVFKIRDGKIIGRQHFYMNSVDQEGDESIVTAFIKQYYLRADYIPREVYIPVDLAEKETIEQWLSQKQNAPVKLIRPRRGEKAKLLKMSQKNAKLLLDELQLQKMNSEAYVSGAVKALQSDLGLENPPKHIEGFDISNIQGTNPVASMVFFKNGKPNKAGYRRFNIRSKSTPDDFAMMNEAVLRRYKRVLEEKKPLPDLILIDGGKGQLSAAMDALQKLHLDKQPVIALAKRLDEVFIPGHTEPQNIRRDSPGLRLLQRVRDESHRFAVTSHRKLRKKRTLKSVLEIIPGVGKKRRDALLKKFGSIKKIKSASVEELAAGEEINKKLAEEIWRFFHQDEKI